MNTETKIEELKERFDLFTDQKDTNNIRQCISGAIEIIEKQSLLASQRVGLYYSIATAYSDIEAIDFNNLNQIQTEELQENYIYYYRAALDQIEDVPGNVNGLYQQVYTNAGNAYSRVGRMLEALRLYDIASTKYGVFPMALGNKGVLSFKLAHFTYDPNHSNILAHFAFYYLSSALNYREYLDKHGEAARCFENIKLIIEKKYPMDFLENPIDLGAFDWGKTKKEKAYRKWVSANNLFLNELNGVVIDPVVATDYLHLPSMIYNTRNERWKFHYGMINQIKQEYVSARYMFYDGIQDRKNPHIADREVLQIEVDMDVSSFSDFSIRTSYRTLYSILDRIAFFLNEYFELGIGVDKVSFRSVWRKKNGQDNILREHCYNNYMLNAIYWLSKDIYEENYTRTTKPSSKEFDTLRNRMEHRYVVSMLDERTDFDEYAYRISTIDLYEKTLSLMRLVREAIIYLSFAIHIEESKKRDDAKAQAKILHQLKTFVMPDSCK